jgi:2-amino-4-hydroxy-6-hydroxymethyldihydropteridine diphosphokinase
MPPPEALARAYIGLGSNLGDPLTQLRAAVAELAALPRARLASCSAPYRSAPVGFTDQPDFVNAACRLDTALTPPELLAALLAIERRRGRVRERAGGPRTLDLDLLLYDGLCLDRPGLRLPHPRMHERAFVLYPLHEIEPGLELPGHGPVAALLAACAGQRIERLVNESLLPSGRDRGRMP